LIFDLDGTLVDTEVQTAQAIATVVGSHGVPDFSLPIVETHGRTWPDIARRILELTRIDVDAVRLVDQMQQQWNTLTAHAQPVPGAQAALRAAATQGLRLAIVSSSPRTVIDSFAVRLGVADIVAESARVGGDDVRHGKPDPEGFLRAAQLLGVPPAEALVFEDSRAGLTAARNAGMASVYITSCAGLDPENAMLATARCRDYHALPPDFWQDLFRGCYKLQGRVFT
jgi:HAD superfamily hydrolase (TIGR01509 family)